MYMWNTTEGGPCFLRPTPANAFDAPHAGEVSNSWCVTDSILVGPNNCTIVNKPWCKNAWCDENMAVHGVGLMRVEKEAIGPWTKPDMSRHVQGWNNQFALPYETGLYWNFTIGGAAQRAVGCPGLDRDFGTIEEPNWTLRGLEAPIWASPAMDCKVNTYAPDGKAMNEIVDQLACDNELWADMFMEGWQQMTSNGYGADDLVDGPQSGWLGHYSLTKQNKNMDPDFETYIILLMLQDTKFTTHPLPLSLLQKTSGAQIG